MKRFLLGLSAFSLLAFIGLQSSHFHAKAPLESCQICVLSAQTLRHLPAAAPTIITSIGWTRIYSNPEAKPRSQSFYYISARAPPEA